MKKYIIVIAGLLLTQLLLAQGPPITSDNPIMLSSGSFSAKTLTEIRTTEEGTFSRIPLMLHYLPTSNTLVALHVPLTMYDFKQNGGRNGSYLGDINILAKYQFYRKDRTAKTFRMVLKTLQNLPTGQPFGPGEISSRSYQSYFALVAGYETIKYGISNELGYNFSPSNQLDELRYKLGFGLPLLKPTYPVNQVNLYFEYASLWRPEAGAYEMLYAQGVQYAKGRITVEAAIQLPLYQSGITQYALQSNLVLGARYIL